MSCPRAWVRANAFLLYCDLRWYANFIFLLLLLPFFGNFRCGESQRFFYMEVGRHSAIGAGELYLETDDPLIAQNMHTTIMKWVKRRSRCNRIKQAKSERPAVPPFDYNWFFWQRMISLLQRYVNGTQSWRIGTNHKKPFVIGQRGIETVVNIATPSNPCRK